MQLLHSNSTATAREQNSAYASFHQHFCCDITWKQSLFHVCILCIQSWSHMNMVDIKCLPYKHKRTIDNVTSLQNCGWIRHSSRNNEFFNILQTEIKWSYIFWGFCFHQHTILYTLISTGITCQIYYRVNTVNCQYIVLILPVLSQQCLSDVQYSQNSTPG